MSSGSGGGAVGLTARGGVGWLCDCGHKVADHKLYFGTGGNTGFSSCSVPDCLCEAYHFRAKVLVA